MDSRIALNDIEICLCDTDLCNDKVCPQQRLHCHQCEKEKSCTKPEILSLRPCLNYISNDECYVVVDRKSPKIC